jgi:hypothetical protein
MKSFQPIDDASLTREIALPVQGDFRKPLGDELKTMFDSLTNGPLPDRLLQLADALEEAFNRGDLFDSRGKLDS